MPDKRNYMEGKDLLEYLPFYSARKLATREEYPYFNAGFDENEERVYVDYDYNGNIVFLQLASDDQFYEIFSVPEKYVRVFSSLIGNLKGERTQVTCDNTGNVCAHLRTGCSNCPGNSQNDSDE